MICIPGLPYVPFACSLIRCLSDQKLCFSNFRLTQYPHEYWSYEVLAHLNTYFLFANIIISHCLFTARWRPPPCHAFPLGPAMQQSIPEIPSLSLCNPLVRRFPPLTAIPPPVLSSGWPSSSCRCVLPEPTCLTSWCDASDLCLFPVACAPFCKCICRAENAPLQ